MTQTQTSLKHTLKYAARKKDAPTVALAFFTFLVLSFPEGLLGVAWPTMRATFQVSLDALGTILLVGTAGSIAVSFVSGRLIRWLGLSRFLFFGILVRAISLVLYVFSPTWGTLIIAVFVAGMGIGAIDVGINAYFSENHSPRLMNWLHASFGVGVTIAPLVMTAILSRGYLWRWGYVVALGFQVCVIIGYLIFRINWQPKQTQAATQLPADASPKGANLHTLRLPVVWLGMVLFFMTSGAEAVIGNWSFSLLHEIRGISLETAGLWVSIYWGSFTVGRILFGLFINNLNLQQVLKVCMVAVGIGGLLIWLNLAHVVSFLGLALIGFALAPVFPLLVFKIPDYVGKSHAKNAIGYNFASASLGLSLLPGLTGILANNFSLEVVGPVVIVAASVMILINEMITQRKQVKVVVKK